MKMKCEHKHLIREGRKRNWICEDCGAIITPKQRREMILKNAIEFNNRWREFDYEGKFIIPYFKVRI